MLFACFASRVSGSILWVFDKRAILFSDDGGEVVGYPIDDPATFADVHRSDPDWEEV